MSDARGFRDGDYLDRAAYDDYLLDLADDEVDREEWARLHGMEREHPSLADVIRETGEARARAERGQR